jgi:hypothetical protein
MVNQGVHVADPTPKTGLVVSAHAADFVWRAGGAVAPYKTREKLAKAGLVYRGEAE